MAHPGRLRKLRDERSPVLWLCTPGAHPSINSLVLLPLPICASYYPATGNTDRSKGLSAPLQQMLEPQLCVLLPMADSGLEDACLTGDVHLVPCTLYQPMFDTLSYQVQHSDGINQMAPLTATKTTLRIPLICASFKTLSSIRVMHVNPDPDPKPNLNFSGGSRPAGAVATCFGGVFP